MPEVTAPSASADVPVSASSIMKYGSTEPRPAPLLLSEGEAEAEDREEAADEGSGLDREGHGLGAAERGLLEVTVGDLLAKGVDRDARGVD